MSELMNNVAYRRNFQWRLLASVSALALLGAITCVGEANAADDDSDRPVVWIELGGQLNRLDDGQEVFAPSLMAARPTAFAPSQNFEKLPQTSIDESGSVSFQPDDSNWVFSASLRYGRAVSSKHVRQQTNPAAFIDYVSGYRYAKYPSASKFADTLTHNSERHLIVDFQVGRDVGLGMFGKQGTSVFSFGARFAQFGTNSNITLKSDPDWHFYSRSFGSLGKIPLGGTYHTNYAMLRASRSFHGIGPSLSWNASAPFMGNGQDSGLALDWGLNAAILFGRQRAQIHHQTTGSYHTAKYHGPYGNPNRKIVSQISANPPPRARTLMVPNIGGFAGASFRYANAKVSFGYRADMFFGAMDGGIDKRKSENVGFYGPFANLSIGIGG
jgi:hypothetical protein